MSQQKQNTDVFTRFTTAVSIAIGRPWVFVVALAILVLWGFSGPLLGFSDTWQLIINTGTTIITFLMVFKTPRTATTWPPTSKWMPS
jgi:low affinity Fe/Cu permease